MKLLTALALSLCLAACNSAPKPLTYKVLSTLPHDAYCYTQGLEFLGPRLFESGGHYGQSSIREVNPKTGEVLRKRPVSPTIFGEGITILNGELFNLSWKEGIANVIEADTFKFLRSHNYQGEGWGLTNDGKRLIMSNGSATITFRDPKTFEVKRSITVTDGDREIDQLNELEYVNGDLYANIYLTDRIARIDPENGKVTGWLDLSALRKQLPTPNRAEAFNGIAYDPTRKHFLVTGKYWPQMFEIQISE